jgi:hypothetical protein
VHERETLHATRIASTPEFLATVRWPASTTVLPIAPDEVLVFATKRSPGNAVASEHALPEIADPHAIVFDDSSWIAYRLDRSAADSLMEHMAAWSLTDGFAQGAVGGIAVKTLVSPNGASEQTATEPAESVLFVVPGAVAADFEDRLDELHALLQRGAQR